MSLERTIVYLTEKGTVQLKQTVVQDGTVAIQFSIFNELLNMLYTVSL